MLPDFCSIMSFPTSRQHTLPLLKERKVGAYNWGFVSGKTQSIYPWDSWVKAHGAEPDVWFHDGSHADGRPYREEEVALIQSLTLS